MVIVSLRLEASKQQRLEFGPGTAAVTWQPATLKPNDFVYIEFVMQGLESWR